MIDVGELTGAWDYSTLPANVRVGSECFIERRESFKRFRSIQQPGMVLGNRVQVHTCVEFNVEAQGVVEIGEDCVLAGPIFMCAQRITLGRRVVVSHDVTIADSDFHPIDREARRRDAVANAPGADLTLRPAYDSRPVVIGDDVWIGIRALILKGVRIGNGARIGPGAVITRDIPPGATVAGNPAQIIEAPPR